MLGVGIDSAEEFHLVALGRPDEGDVEVVRVDHTPAALESLVARTAALDPDPAEVRVVLETSHGALVERLLDAGYVVVPVNPDLVARRRGPARKKDDAEDAWIACLLALDRHERLRPLIPHGGLAAELRAIARYDERAARDERRLLNRLRADLIATFPAALAIAGDDLVAPTMLRLAAGQLLLLGAQRRAWERRMGELLLGERRFGRVREPQADERGEQFPGGEIYLSFPGLGDRLAARVASEIGDHPAMFASPNGLQCYAGTAPVTRRSGKSELVVSTRLACNGHLRDAVPQWAFCSLLNSGWAREFYDGQVAKGKHHHAALRALGNRWLEILWHCLMRRVSYDEAIHVASRNRALQRDAGNGG